MKFMIKSPSALRRTDMMDMMERTSNLILSYRELKQFRSLLINLIEVNPNLRIGRPGPKIDELKPILQKIERKYNQVKEYQMLACNFMEKHFNSDWIRIAENGEFHPGSGIYWLDTVSMISLTLKETLALKYYAEWFKVNSHEVVFKVEYDYMSQKGHVKDNIDILILKLSKCLTDGSIYNE